MDYKVVLDKTRLSPALASVYMSATAAVSTASKFRFNPTLTNFGPSFGVLLWRLVAGPSVSFVQEEEFALGRGPLPVWTSKSEPVTRRAMSSRRQNRWAARKDGFGEGAA